MEMTTNKKYVAQSGLVVPNTTPSASPSLANAPATNTSTNNASSDVLMNLFNQARITPRYNAPVMTESQYYGERMELPDLKLDQYGNFNSFSGGLDPTLNSMTEGGISQITGPGFLPEINSSNPRSTYEEHGVNNIYKGGSHDYMRAYNQGPLSSIWTATKNLIPNIGLGLVESIGAIGTLFYDPDNDYSNGLTEWAKANKNPAGEIYMLNPDNAFDVYDSGWWIKHIGSGAESAIQFALLGAGTGAVLGKGASALATTFRAAAPTTRTLMGASALASAATLAYTEGVMSGAEVYKSVLQKHKDKGMLPEYAMERAAAGAATTVQINTAINTGLNLTSVLPFLKSTKSLADDIGKKGFQNLEDAAKKSNLDDAIKAVDNATLPDITVKERVGKYALEMGQESLEELTNVFAEKAGEKVGSMKKEEYDAKIGDGVRGFFNQFNELENYLNYVSNDEGASSAFWGGVIGAGQRFASRRIPLSKDFDYHTEGEKAGEVIRDDKGEPIKRWKNTKTKEEEARKIAFNSAKYDLATDLANVKENFESLEEVLANRDNKSEAEVNAQVEYIKHKLFSAEAYRSIASGNGKLLSNLFENISNVDNTNSYNDKLDTNYQQFEKAMAEELAKQPDQQDQDYMAKIKANMDRIDKLRQATKGTAITEAMAKGLAKDQNDNDYKERAKQAIESIKEYQTLYDDIMTYNNYGDAESQAYAKQLFNLKASIKFHEKEIAFAENIIKASEQEWLRQLEENTGKLNKAAEDAAKLALEIEARQKRVDDIHEEAKELTDAANSGDEAKMTAMLNQLKSIYLNEYVQIANELSKNNTQDVSVKDMLHRLALVRAEALKAKKETYNKEASELAEKQRKLLKDSLGVELEDNQAANEESINNLKKQIEEHADAQKNAIANQATEHKANLLKRKEILEEQRKEEAKISNSKGRKQFIENFKEFHKKQAEMIKKMMEEENQSPEEPEDKNKQDPNATQGNNTSPSSGTQSQSNNNTQQNNKNQNQNTPVADYSTVDKAHLSFFASLEGKTLTPKEFIKKAIKFFNDAAKANPSLPHLLQLKAKYQYYETLITSLPHDVKIAVENNPKDVNKAYYKIGTKTITFNTAKINNKGTSWLFESLFHESIHALTSAALRDKTKGPVFKKELYDYIVSLIGTDKGSLKKNLAELKSIITRSMSDPADIDFVTDAMDSLNYVMSRSDDHIYDEITTVFSTAPGLVNYLKSVQVPGPSATMTDMWTMLANLIMRIVNSVISTPNKYTEFMSILSKNAGIQLQPLSMIVSGIELDVVYKDMAYGELVMATQSQQDPTIVDLINESGELVDAMPMEEFARLVNDGVFVPEGFNLKPIIEELNKIDNFDDLEAFKNKYNKPEHASLLPEINKKDAQLRNKRLAEIESKIDNILSSNKTTAEKISEVNNLIKEVEGLKLNSQPFKDKLNNSLQLGIDNANTIDDVLGMVPDEPIDGLSEEDLNKFLVAVEKKISSLLSDYVKSNDDILNDDKLDPNQKQKKLSDNRVKFYTALGKVNTILGKAPDKADKEETKKYKEAKVALKETLASPLSPVRNKVEYSFIEAYSKVDQKPKAQLRFSKSNEFAVQDIYEVESVEERDGTKVYTLKSMSGAESFEVEEDRIYLYSDSSEMGGKKRSADKEIIFSDKYIFSAHESSLGDARGDSNLMPVKEVEDYLRGILTTLQFYIAQGHMNSEAFNNLWSELYNRYTNNTESNDKAKETIKAWKEFVISKLSLIGRPGVDPDSINSKIEELTNRLIDILKKAEVENSKGLDTMQKRKLVADKVASLEPGDNINNHFRIRLTKKIAVNKNAVNQETHEKKFKTKPLTVSQKIQAKLLHLNEQKKNKLAKNEAVIAIQSFSPDGIEPVIEINVGTNEQPNWVIVSNIRNPFSYVKLTSAASTTPELAHPGVYYNRYLTAATQDEKSEILAEFNNMYTDDKGNPFTEDQLKAIGENFNKSVQLWEKLQSVFDDNNGTSRNDIVLTNEASKELLTLQFNNSKFAFESSTNKLTLSEVEALKINGKFLVVDALAELDQEGKAYVSEVLGDLNLADELGISVFDLFNEESAIEIPDRNKIRSRYWVLVKDPITSKIRVVAARPRQATTDEIANALKAINSILAGDLSNINSMDSPEYKSLIKNLNDEFRKNLYIATPNLDDMKVQYFLALETNKDGTIKKDKDGKPIVKLQQKIKNKVTGEIENNTFTDLDLTSTDKFINSLGAANLHSENIKVSINKDDSLENISNKLVVNVKKQVFESPNMQIVPNNSFPDNETLNVESDKGYSDIAKNAFNTLLNIFEVDNIGELTKITDSLIVPLEDWHIDALLGVMNANEALTEKTIAYLKEIGLVTEDEENNLYFDLPAFIINQLFADSNTLVRDTDIANLLGITEDEAFTLIDWFDEDFDNEESNYRLSISVDGKSYKLYSEENDYELSEEKTIDDWSDMTPEERGANIQDNMFFDSTNNMIFTPMSDELADMIDGPADNILSEIAIELKAKDVSIIVTAFPINLQANPSLSNSFIIELVHDNQEANLRKLAYYIHELTGVADPEYIYARIAYDQDAYNKYPDKNKKAYDEIFNERFGKHVDLTKLVLHKDAKEEVEESKVEYEPDFEIKSTLGSTGTRLLKNSKGELLSYEGSNSIAFIKKVKNENILHAFLNLKEAGHFTTVHNDLSAAFDVKVTNQHFRLGVFDEYLEKGYIVIKPAIYNTAGELVNKGSIEYTNSFYNTIDIKFDNHIDFQVKVFNLLSSEDARILGGAIEALKWFHIESNLSFKDVCSMIINNVKDKNIKQASMFLSSISQSKEEFEVLIKLYATITKSKYDPNQFTYYADKNNTVIKNYMLLLKRIESRIDSDLIPLVKQQKSIIINGFTVNPQKELFNVYDNYITIVNNIEEYENILSLVRSYNSVDLLIDKIKDEIIEIKNSQVETEAPLDVDNTSSNTNDGQNLVNNLVNSMISNEGNYIEITELLNEFINDWDITMSEDYNELVELVTSVLNDDGAKTPENYTTLFTAMLEIENYNNKLMGIANGDKLGMKSQYDKTELNKTNYQFIGC